MQLNNEKISIVFLFPSLKTGGGNRVFIELANNLPEDKYDVTIICPRSKEENAYIIAENIAIKQVGELPLNNRMRIRNILKTLRVVRKDYKNSLLIISDPIISLFIGTLIRKKNVYRFIQANDYTLFDDRFLIKNLLALKVYKRWTLASFKARIHYIFNSVYSYKCFEKVSGRSFEPDVVHPGIDPLKFNIERRRPAMEGQGLTLSLIARKHPLKGLNDFFEAWKIMDNEAKDKVTKVLLITHDDILVPEDDKFSIVSPHNDLEMSSLYQSSDIFLSCSWEEGFGLPGVEAMACGCCLVTSDSGGINEYAVNGKNSLIYPPRETSMLKECLERVILDGQLRRQFSIQGMADAAGFTWKNSAKFFESLIVRDIKY